MSEYLTTREIAELLRIKERKVYDLAASGEIPCSRATGKLLFPRAAVERWLAANSSGGGVEAQTAPRVVLGSHDPLLDWALRESGSGLASFLNGSLDGLNRFAAGEGAAAALHIYDADSDSWNMRAVARSCAGRNAVLVEWAWRQRGLIVAVGAEREVRGVGDLAGRRVVPRQREAGSQILFEALLERSGVAGELSFTEAARTEAEVALAVLEGEAEAGFGLQAVAQQHRLGFVPLLRERFDLVVDRRAWFEPPWQTLLSFARSETFATKAQALGGYDIAGAWQVQLNL